jgi:hypothetical protein
MEYEEAVNAILMHGIGRDDEAPGWWVKQEAKEALERLAQQSGERR